MKGCLRDLGSKQGELLVFFSYPQPQSLTSSLASGVLGRWDGERKGEAAPGTVMRATELLGRVPGAGHEPCDSCRTVIIID